MILIDKLVDRSLEDPYLSVLLKKIENRYANHCINNEKKSTFLLKKSI